MSEVEQSAEDRVRERAYALWERDGCPDGRSDEYWEQATREMGISMEPDDALTESTTSRIREDGVSGLSWVDAPAVRVTTQMAR